jgi:hypothetical protein
MKQELKEYFSSAIIEVISEVPPALDIRIVPTIEDDSVVWLLEGDIKGALKRLADNIQIGALDTLSSIRRQRNMLYALRKKRS